MNELEEAGYLFQPHTSAGRIPTDKGYRYFVEKIMPDKELSKVEQKKLQAELLKLQGEKYAAHPNDGQTACRAFAEIWRSAG